MSILTEEQARDQLPSEWEIDRFYINGNNKLCATFTSWRSRGGCASAQTGQLLAWSRTGAHGQEGQPSGNPRNHRQRLGHVQRTGGRTPDRRPAHPKPTTLDKQPSSLRGCPFFCSCYLSLDTPSCLCMNAQEDSLR